MHVHRCARHNEAHRPVRPRAHEALLVAGHRVRLMPRNAALLPHIACDSSLPTLFACFYLPRATLCAPQTRRQANLWAPRTSGARSMHPLRSPHPRAASLLRRRRRERLNCIDAAAGPDAGCHAVWRRDASFRSPPRPRGCGRWSTRTARAAGNLLTGVGVTSCPAPTDNGASHPILEHAPCGALHPPSLLRV